MAFVVTSGQLQAVNERSDYGTWGAGSLALTPYLTQTYEQLWRAQPALRTVTGFLARSVAQLSIDPYRRVSSTDRVKALDHPLSALLERPMDGTKWTKYRLLNTLMHDLCVFDNAYWIKIRGPRGILGLQPVPPRFISPRGANPFQPEAYRFTGPKGYRDLKPDQVVHFHGYNPDDPRLGAAPVETLRQVLAEEHAATVYREQLWRNGARVAGYLSRPIAAPKWQDPVRARFRAEWQAQYTGDGPATGGTPVLEDGMTFNPNAVSPKDAQYVEARKLTREEVAVAYFIPPVMVGLMEGVNFGSVKELHTMLYQDTLPPWLEQISQDIEVQLLEDLDPGARQDGERSVYVEFNLKAKLQGSFEEQARSLQSAVGAPWMLRNEARAMNNLPALPDGDDLVTPLNVLVGGLASPNDTAPPDDGEIPAAAQLAALHKHLSRQVAAVVSRLGAGERDPARLLPAKRWDTELAIDVRIPPGAAAEFNSATRAALAAAVTESNAQDAVVQLYRQRGVADTADRMEQL